MPFLFVVNFIGEDKQWVYHVAELMELEENQCGGWRKKTLLCARAEKSVQSYEISAGP